MSDRSFADLFVVDSEPLARMGMARLVETHHSIRLCGEAGDLETARLGLEKWRPALALVDVSLSGSQGLSILGMARRSSPKTKIVVVVRNGEAEAVIRAMRLGASGVVSRKDTAVSLLNVLLRVLMGERQIGPTCEAALFRGLARSRDGRMDLQLCQLSDREREIFTLIGEGNGPTEIARLLGVSVKTVESHQERLKIKLQVDSCQKLRRQAILEMYR